MANKLSDWLPLLTHPEVGERICEAAGISPYWLETALVRIGLPEWGLYTTETNGQVWLKENP